MKKFLLRRYTESSRHIEAGDWDAAHKQLIAFQQEPMSKPDANAHTKGTIEYLGERDAGRGEIATVFCPMCRRETFAVTIRESSSHIGEHGECHNFGGDGVCDACGFEDYYYDGSP